MAQTNQTIDGKRLWDSLMDMARFGATEKGGVKRLTLTDIDRQGRDYFRANCEAAGLTVRVAALAATPNVCQCCSAAIWTASRRAASSTVRSA